MTSPRSYTAELAGAASRTEADAVAEVAAQAAQVRILDGVGLAVGMLVADVGPGRRLEVLDLERHLSAPRAKRGTVTVTTPAALVHYVKEHSEDGTTMWADRDAGKVVAVLDDHQPGVDAVEAERAGWGQHRAVLQLSKTPDWLHWTAKDGELLDQATFAERLETGLPAIVAPAAADVLEAARTLSIQRAVTFSSADRPTSGEIRFVYQEEDSARAGKRGDLELPEQITLRLAPWEGCEPRDIDARLRYRLVDGRLLLGYQLVRPDDLLRAAWEEIVTDLDNQTEVYVYAGTPRS